MMTIGDDYYHLAPVGAPPLLTDEQVIELCVQGWLDFDLPTQLQEEIIRLQSEAAQFFQQNTDSKTAAFGTQELEEEGYYHVPYEKEYITFRREVIKPLALQDTVKHVWEHIAAILHRMLCDLSRAGGLDTSAWDEVIKGTLSFPGSQTDLRHSTTLLRLFRYEPATGMAAKHTDLGLLTMCVGSGAGLEVMDLSSRPFTWKPSPRCTVLVGETLRKLSNDNINPGIHRVVENPEGRQSLVFALRPNLSSTVDLAAFGGEGSASLREMFQTIKGSKYNVNAKKEIREQQREKQKLQKGLAESAASSATITHPG